MAGAEARAGQGDQAAERSTGCWRLVVAGQQVVDAARDDHSCEGPRCGICALPTVDQLLLFHHDPARTDDQIDSIVTGYKDAKVRVQAAVQGSILNLR